MTPYSHYVAPPPLVTRIHPFSQRYGQLQRLWHTSAAILRPLARVAGAMLRLLTVTLPFLITRPAKWLFRTIVATLRAIDRIADAVVTIIFDILVAAAKKLVMPLLSLSALLALLIFISRSDVQPHRDVPALAAIAPQATAHPAQASPIRKTPTAPARKLAAFHAPDHVFSTERASVAALADALNIPPKVVSTGVTRALALAADNANAMRPYVGRFPLPKNTPNRLLTALTPSDITQLSRLLEHSTTIDKREFTLTANLASGDLSLTARIRKLTSSAAPGACFRYALTFMRRTFQHTLSMTACRQRGTWSFPADQKGQ
ncbi:hypothetical protein [Hyphomicrobium zavarzinii]|uniref:hypothetical protein n=1 Tax=Hyphomicrobium zavarzinii TaxID=48292 RepID=UPI0012EBCB04|nr:hypothetical protein [Hyphomicrobium zavarzinii]